MKLTLHPEGVAIAVAFGVALLLLVWLLFRDSVFTFLFEKAADAMEDGPENGKKSRKQRKFGQERWRKLRIVFYCLCGFIVAWIFADWLWIPERLSAGTGWRWPLATATFFSGVVVIFIGAQKWDGRLGWRKWTFWEALLAATLSLIAVMRWIQTKRPSTVAGLSVLAGILFLWLFGMLRRIDRNKSPGDASDPDAAD